MSNYLQFILRAKKLRRNFEDPIRKKLDIQRKYLNENGFKSGKRTFEVGKELGRGGFSSVLFLHETISPYRSYALKITFAQNERHHVLLQKEIGILRDLSDSKRIIKMIANDIKDGLIFIVLELGENNLIQYLERNQKDWIDLQVRFLLLDTYIYPSQLMNIWTEILQGVKEIHDKRVIHMDLKMENFVVANQVLKIIDFGAAYQLPKGQIEMDVDEIFGTEGLCAPECFHSRVLKMNDNIRTISSISQKSDIWSLGIMLLQMLEPKFDLTPVIKKIKFFSEEGTDNKFCHLFQRTIASCLKKNPRERSSIDELIQIRQTHLFYYSNSR